MTTEAQAVEAIRQALDAGPTPGPWAVQTSCSWRRIGNDRGDGNVICPTINRNDNTPDLLFKNGGQDGPDARYIAAANPEALRAILIERDAYKARIAALEAAHNTKALAELQRNAARYNAFFADSLSVCFRGVEYHDKPSLDAAIDADRSAG